MTINYLPPNSGRVIRNCAAHLLLDTNKLKIILDDAFDIDNYDKFKKKTQTSSVNKSGEETTDNEKSQPAVGEEEYFCSYDSIKYEIFSLKLFGLHLTNNNDLKIPSDFCEILSFLLVRQDMLRLEIIRALRPDLLSINLTTLIMIVFYGRAESLQFVIDHMRDHFLTIITSNNPYDISQLQSAEDEKYYDFNSIEDIWDGHNWYNDLGERPIIGTTDFDKTFDILNSFSTDYPTVKFGEKEILMWLETGVVERYFIKREKLLTLLKSDLTTRDGIKRFIEVVGLQTAWSILRSKDADTLAILLQDVEVKYIVLYHSQFRLGQFSLIINNSN
jgi:hypothetical protein